MLVALGADIVRQPGRRLGRVGECDLFQLGPNCANPPRLAVDHPGQPLTRLLGTLGPASPEAAPPTGV